MLLAGLAMVVPAASADPFNCNYASGTQWLDCGGSVYAAGHDLPIGATTSPECGHEDWGNVFAAPAAPSVGRCSVWIGVAAGYVIVGTPDPSSVTQGHS